MNSSQKWTIGAVVVVVAALVILAVRNQPSNAPSGGQMENQQEQAMMPEGPVRIGLMLPLTGDAASYGITVQKAALLAQEEINAAGGVAGQNVEFVTEDSKCDPAAGVAAAQKLVNVDKVSIIFGGACSGETLAALPITEEAKVLMISPSATSPDLSKADDYFFRTISSDAKQGVVAANYAFETLKAKTVGVIAEQTDYAQGLAGVFKTRFQELGGTVVVDEVYQTSDTDLRAQVLKVKQGGVDLVYIVPQSPAKGELIVKQLKAQEVAATFLTTESFLDRSMIAKDPALFSGIYATEPYFDQSAELAAAFLVRYQAKYNESPTYPTFAASMYSQVYLIKEGVETVGMDTTRLKEWLMTVKDWQHAMGLLNFTPEGDAISPYAVDRIKADGTIERLKEVRP